MSSDHQKTGRSRTKRKLGLFCRDRKGATVIEFALLAFPFTLLIFAILESCISFAAEEYLQNVTDDLARQIRTGQLRPADLTGGQLETLICDRLEVFVSDCPGEALSVDLRHFDTFAQIAALTYSIDAAGELKVDGGFKVDPGPSQSKNILRVFYRWPVITDIMRSRMSNLDDGKILHFATATWQNEPFDD